MTHRGHHYQLDCKVLAYSGVDGYGESGFDSGEEACEMAFISKDSSRRVNCRLSKARYSDKTYCFVGVFLQKRNEKELKRINEEQLEGKFWCQQPR
jgi:hypothetical protein